MKNWIIGDDCCSLLSIPYAYAPTPCLTDPSHPMSTFLRFISLTIFFSSDRGIAVSPKVRSYGCDWGAGRNYIWSFTIEIHIGYVGELECW